jgi:hypothetical protein
MAEHASKQRPTRIASADSLTRSWQVLKKHPWQLIAASVLLATWIMFLVTMAAYN